MKVFPASAQKGSASLLSSLERKEKEQQIITRRRAEETADLVMGKHSGIPLRYLSYPVMGVIVVVAAVGSGLSMIPLHDIMKEPGYW